MEDVLFLLLPTKCSKCGTWNTFTCDGAAKCCAAIDCRKFVAGDEGGRLYFVSLEDEAEKDVSLEQ